MTEKAFEQMMSGLKQAKDEYGRTVFPDCSSKYYAVRDAIELLKKQEPKQIVRKQGKRENSDGSIDYFGEWYCPHCGKLLNRGFDLPWIEFCYKCGGAVIWNDI